MANSSLTSEKLGDVLSVVEISEWRDEYIGNLVSLEYGSALGAEVRTGRGFPVYGSNGVVGRHEAALVTGPGVIVGRKGSVGAVQWSDEDYWPIDTTYWVDPKVDLDLHWIFECLKLIGLESLDSSTGVPGLNRNDAYQILVPVPPLKEQRQITKVFDDVDKVIRSTEDIIAKYEGVRTGLASDLLGCLVGGVGDRSVRDLIYTEFAGEWGEADKRNGLCECMVLRATNFTANGINYKTAARRFISKPKAMDKRLKRGDLILEAAGGGPGIPVGRVARFDPPDEQIYIVSNFFRTLRPLQNVDSGFLYYILNYLWKQPKIWQVQQQTTGIINLKVADYLRIKIGVPKLEEQRRIANILDDFDNVIQANRRQLEKLRQLRSGLAADLFSGRVRTVKE